jgi:hypothetical protein
MFMSKLNANDHYIRYFHGPMNPPDLRFYIYSVRSNFFRKFRGISLSIFVTVFPAQGRYTHQLENDKLYNPGARPREASPGLSGSTSATRVTAHDNGSFVAPNI